METSCKTGGSPPLRGVSVLVVEDDFIVGLGIEGILSGAGALVIGPAPSVSRALQLVETMPITCALLDVRLGQETALAVALRLRQRGIPFALYTGQIESELGPEWPKSLLISKPALPANLISAIGQLSNPRAGQ
jgi:CheY-like chemotaxis protein